ncbi:MAG: DUF6599 family protein [Thermodesulfobacteriota bacterium]
MKWLKIVCFIIFSFFIALPLFAGQSKLAQLFPKEIEAQGWVLEEEPLIAYDENSLSMIINGAAPQYIKLGTKRAAFVNYVKKGIYMMLEIYETGSSKNAERIYKEFEPVNSEVLNDLGEQARFTSGLGGIYMAEYFQERFYVRISIMQKSEEAENAILECGSNISDKITKNSKP